MKTLLKVFAVFLLIFVMGVTGCAAPATQPPPTQTPVPEVKAEDSPLAKIVLEMAERLNAGDLEGSLNYFADNSVTYFVGMPPTGMEIYRGKEGIRPIWEECIGSHFKMEVEIVSVIGDVVNAKSKTWHDFTRQLEVAPNEFIETYVIKDGKITLYSSVLTEESLAKFKPALAAVMPPEPTAVPSTDTPVSEINVIIADDTCGYEGVLVLKAGPVTVNVDATGEDTKTFGLTFFTLDPGKDIIDLMATTPLPSPPSWAKVLTLWEVGPGTSQTNTLTVEKGPLYLVCWSKPPDLAVGNVGPFEVSMAANVDKPAEDVGVTSLAVLPEDLLGKWATFCPGAHENCTWEFRADGRYARALIRIPGSVFSGTFTFQNGQLNFETDNGLCADMPQATYEVYVVKQNGKAIGLQLKVVGGDPCKDRLTSLGELRPFVSSQ